MNHQLLTRAECKAMRGLAIIGIFMHNYCHWLNPVVKENEYQYFQSNTDWFKQVLSAPDELLPMHLLSFFGHYGVPVFLFLWIGDEIRDFSRWTESAKRQKWA